MKRKLTAAIALAALAPLASVAEVSLYGKANVSIEAVSEDDDSYSNIQSNASRLGFKGTEKISDDLQAIYKMEYEVFVDDGEKSQRTFTQRNIYVGLKGGFGTALLGRMDTPLKTAQNKVDLFGDLHGDIKNRISRNENREDNTLAYITPEMGGVTAKLSYMPSEEDGVDDASSVSVSYGSKTVYFSVAYDAGVEDVDTDATRIVTQLNLGDVQLGALYESFGPAAGENLDAAFVSIKLKAGKQLTLKAQYGQSDQFAEGGDTISLGLDYSLSKSCKLFGFHTINGADNNVVDDKYTGLGIELKFKS